VLPDLDHLFGGEGVGTFHNLIVLFAVPLALFMFVFMIERSRDPCSSAYQRFFLAVVVVLTSHLFLDIVSGSTVMLNLSSTAQPISFVSTPLVTTEWGTLVETMDLIWVVIVATVLVGVAAQEVMYENAEGTDLVQSRRTGIPLNLSKPRPQY
jgi:hypothetical protein